MSIIIIIRYKHKSKGCFINATGLRDCREPSFSTLSDQYSVPNGLCPRPSVLSSRTSLSAAGVRGPGGCGVAHALEEGDKCSILESGEFKVEDSLRQSTSPRSRTRVDEQWHHQGPTRCSFSEMNGTVASCSVKFWQRTPRRALSERNKD